MAFWAGAGTGTSTWNVVDVGGEVIRGRFVGREGGDWIRAWVWVEVVVVFDFEFLLVFESAREAMGLRR